MPPRVTTTETSGRGLSGVYGPGFMTPANRMSGLIISIDWGDIPTLPDRMADHFQQALIFHLGDAAQRVIDTTRHYLVRLEEEPVMVNSEGFPIHGYDTGLMYTSLKYSLAGHLLGTGVFYDLLSEDAEYWRYVEFGHWVAAAAGWWFWPGYHMLETGIRANEGYIRQRVREAWADTSIALAMEAHVPNTSGRIGLTNGVGIGGISNVVNVHPRVP
jgi:hypothetical protein